MQLLRVSLVTAHNGCYQNQPLIGKKPHNMSHLNQVSDFPHATSC